MKVTAENQFPKARHDRLIVKELPGETLVYDLLNDKAHCLNETAAKIWKDCDGNKSVADINTLLTQDVGAPVDEGVVWLALDQLEKFNLLQETAVKPASLLGMNRRQLVRSIGGAALALPLIISIATQTAQAQASCTGSNRPDGCPCSNPSPCISGHHCNGGICGP